MSYNRLRRQIIKKLKMATKELEKLGYKSQHISPKEFYDYMTGETPTGDIISVADVLSNEFLLIHEIVEISELKKFGIEINKHTVMMFHPKVYEAHYVATEYEFNYALGKQNYDWLKVRIEHAKSWLKDETMPPHLAPKFKALIEKFSEVLLKEK
jgi:hypothetical protein